MTLKFKVMQYEVITENFGNLSAHDIALNIMQLLTDCPEVFSVARPDFDITILDKAGQWQYGKMYIGTPVTYENLMRIVLEVRSYFKLICLTKLGN